MSEYWNHNVAYYPLVLGAVPAGCRDVLDVGCADGMLARRLAAPGRRVVGLDRSAEMIQKAEELGAGIAGLEFLVGDYLERPFPQAGFDLVSFVASVHHMDTDAALKKAVDLLRPGGSLVVIGLARNGTPLDWLISGLCLPVTRLLDRTHPLGSPGAPVFDAALSWGEVRQQARELLPGARYRQHLHYRYSLRWTKPGERVPRTEPAQP